MKKIYIRPETEQITAAWAKCDSTTLDDHASRWTTDNGATFTKIEVYGDETGETAENFDVGAKKFIWDDEDSPWNN